MLERLVAKALSNGDGHVAPADPPRVALTREGDYIGSRSPAVAQELLLDGLRRLSTEGLTSVSTGTARLVTMLGAKETPAQLLFSEEVNVHPGRRQRFSQKASSPGKS